MFDVILFFPDYAEWDKHDESPYDPYDDIPYWERERLNDELYRLIDAGAFDPENENPI
jgi:hypothetical protein